MTESRKRQPGFDFEPSRYETCFLGNPESWRLGVSEPRRRPEPYGPAPASTWHRESDVAHYRFLLLSLLSSAHREKHISPSLLKHSAGSSPLVLLSPIAAKKKIPFVVYPPTSCYQLCLFASSNQLHSLRTTSLSHSSLSLLSSLPEWTCFHLLTDTRREVSSPISKSHDGQSTLYTQKMKLKWLSAWFWCSHANGALFVFSMHMGPYGNKQSWVLKAKSPLSGESSAHQTWYILGARRSRWKAQPREFLSSGEQVSSRKWQKNSAS